METKLQYDEEVRRRINIMEAYLEGKPVEIKGLVHDPEKWFPLGATQFDDWGEYDYRVNSVPDTIDWSAINSKYCYLARDGDGYVYLYEEEPVAIIPDGVWEVSDGLCIDARIFTSYKEGHYSWNESLVERP